jgi:hypothetical protein
MLSPTPLKEPHVTKVCRAGQGAATCSFLLSGSPPFCVKRTKYEWKIRAARRANQIAAQGDHCSGPPAFVLKNGAELAVAGNVASG